MTVQPRGRIVSRVPVRFWFTVGLLILFVIAAAIDAALILRSRRPKIVLLSTLLAFSGFVVGVLAPVYDPSFWVYLTVGAVLVLSSAAVRQWPRKSVD